MKYTKDHIDNYYKNPRMFFAYEITNFGKNSDFSIEKAKIRLDVQSSKIHNDVLYCDDL